MNNLKTSGKINAWLLIGILVLILVIIFVFRQGKSTNEVISNNSAGNVDTAENMDASMETMDSEEDSVTEQVEEMADEPAPIVSQVGTYADYDPTKLANAGNGRTVLFFHASWCPSCRALEKNVENNLSAIPADVTILVVNYDKETDLKKKYGVTRQHTLVQVDSEGNEIKTLTGLTNTLEQVLGQL